MSAILPVVVLVLTSLTGLEAGGVSEKEGKSLKATRVLPVGFYGLWGEGGMEPEAWAQKGESTVLGCRISRLQAILQSQPGANVTWFKDDLPLLNKRAFVTKEGHLNITKVIRRKGRASPETDEGVYRCLLVLTKGVKYMVSSLPISLHVAEIGRHVTVSSTNVSAVSGSSVRVKCHVPSQPPAYIQWLDSQGYLPHNHKYRFTQPISGVLQINDVQKSDSGYYRCSATNEVLNKTRLSEDILLTVQDPTKGPHSASFTAPSFLFPTSNITVRAVVKWSATLECQASGVPLPEITWRRKGIFMTDDDPWEDIYESEDESFIGQGNLHIHSSTLSKAGRYLCTATSTDPIKGRVSITREIKLVVIDIPIIKNPPMNVTTLIAKTVRLNCSVKHVADKHHIPPNASLFFPPPRIAWFKDGLPLQTDTRIQLRDGAQLVFVNSVTKDTGVYQCLVTNEAGYATAWSHLLVDSSGDHPAPPWDLQFIHLSPTSVKLKWKKGYSPASDKILAYSIHFVEYNGSVAKESQVVSYKTEQLYENLKPNTNYSFMVRAYSSYASDPSEVAHFTTGEDVPLAVPEISLEPLSSTSLLVSWLPLPAEMARGTINGYKIQYQPRKKDYYHLKEVEADVFSHIVRELHPGMTYKIRVLARTKAGYNEGVDWPWKSITMPDVGMEKSRIVPKAPMMHIKMQEHSEGIEVTWKRHPEDKVPLEGYSLRYKRGGSSKEGEKNIYLPYNVHSYVIPIKESDWYEITLWGYNEEGEGSPTVEVFHTQGPEKRNVSKGGTSTKATQMPTIEKVRLNPESQTIVHLSWEVSQVKEKPALFYTIKQELVSSNGQPQQQKLSRSTTKSMSIDDLIPFTTYQFSVRAHVSEDEFGPYSLPVQTNAMGNIPTAPRGVSYEPKDASTMEIRWMPAPSHNGSPTKYQIIFTRNKTLPLSKWNREEVAGDIYSCTLSGLVSNADYWIRVRGCDDNVCGSFSDFVSAKILAILPDSSWKLYMIVGLTVTFIAFLLIVFAVYILKFRGSNFSPMRSSNINGPHGHATHNEGGRGPHGRGRNGVSEMNDREGDYIPMLNRIHTDLPTSPLDTKGGYSTRVNGFANSKCNGVVRSKETHFGAAPTSKKDEDMEERQRLFSASPNGDLVTRVYGGDGSSPSPHHVKKEDPGNPTTPTGVSPSKRGRIGVVSPLSYPSPGPECPSPTPTKQSV